MKLYIARRPDGCLRITDEGETAVRLSKGELLASCDGNCMALYNLEFPEIKSGEFRELSVTIDSPQTSTLKGE